MQGWFWNLLKRWWTLVVAAAVVAVVAFESAGYMAFSVQTSNCHAPAPRPWRTPTTTPNAFSSKSSAPPGAPRPSTFSTKWRNRTVSTTLLPWAHELVTNDPTLFADLRAQGTGDTTSCRITVDGIVKDERTVTIVNGYTTCLDKSA